MYFLQPRILNLGYAYLSTAPVPIAAQPVLEEMSEALGEASSVAVLDDGAVVYVGRAATKRIMSVTLGVGSRLPAYCTALGRVLLAHLTEEQVNTELSKVDFVQHTKHTVHLTQAAGRDPAGCAAGRLRAQRPGARDRAALDRPCRSGTWSAQSSPR